MDFGGLARGIVTPVPWLNINNSLFTLQRMASKRLHALDGLRGVAAIAVMLFHCHLAPLLFLHGYLAIDLFFMLSGYVIGRSYEPLLAQGKSARGMGIGQYTLIRLERLYPMLLLGTLIGFGCFAFGLSEFVPKGRGDLLLSVFAQLLLIPIASSAGWFVFNRVQWTIVFELMANVIHATALPKLTVRVLMAIVMIAALGLASSAQQCGTFDAVCDWYWIQVPSRTLFGFFMGVLLCRTQGHWQKFVAEVDFVLLALLLVALLNMPVAWTNTASGRPVYEFVCVTLIFPLILMLGVKARADRVATELGTLSYPLYAIHLPLMNALGRYGASVGQAFVAMFGLVILAWAIGHWIDEPIIAWRRRSRRRAETHVRIPALLQSAS